MPFAYQALKARATVPGQAGTPSITSQASGSIGLSWSAPAFTGGAPLTDYKLEYSTNAGGAWSTYSHAAGWATSVTATGLADYLTYIWRVSAINAVGTGTVSGNSANAEQFNAATGGTENTVSNYNGTGQTWKTHAFGSPSTFTASRTITAYRVLCVGGGTGGGPPDDPANYYGGNTGGSGGKVYATTAATFSVSGHTVTIGGGGGTPYGAGGASSVGGYSSASGSTGGGGGPGGPSEENVGSPGGAGPTNDITGTNLYWAGGGGGGGCNLDLGDVSGGTGGNRGGGPGGSGGYGSSTNGTAGTANTGGGGGGGARQKQDGTPFWTASAPGGSGYVVVAYRTA